MLDLWSVQLVPSPVRYVTRLIGLLAKIQWPVIELKAGLKAFFTGTPIFHHEYIHGDASQEGPVGCERREENKDEECACANSIGR